MKKSLVLFFALLLMGSGFAQKAPTTKLVSSSEDKIVVNVQLNGYSTQKVQTPQGDQFIVNVPEMAAMLEAGTPNLPTFPIPVIIGDRAEMNVSVIDAQYTDYPNIDIAPSKGNISRQINPDDVPYTYGSMYQQDAFYPATQAYLEAPYILRDFRGQNIMVQPFAYNPQTHTLRVYDNLTVQMTKVSDNGENQKAARRSNSIKVDPETQHSYSRRFLNYGESTAKYNFVSDNGEMLVICADQFIAGMQPLVDWKNESGRPTTMVTVTEVGGNNDNSIKNYISSIYNDPSRNLQFVLFVGDYEHITPHALSGERSDNWFGQLEGNDHYPEVFVGRFSVQSDAHVATQVNKVIYYERDMPGDITWGNKGLGIGYIGAGSGHYGEDDYQHIDLIRDTLLHYTYETVTELHGGGGGASTGSISNTINQGVSIVNYCNHGSESGWGVAGYSSSNVHALTNDNKLPIVWSVACLCGKFNYGSECFAEAWMRATDNANGTPTGAIGGMFSWMSQPWIPPMYGQDEMVDILAEWRGGDQFHHTLAGASLNGNMNVIDKSGASGYDTHDTWILFGDPSLMMRTENPTDMEVTASPSVLLLGMTELVVNANADFGIATLCLNGEVIASSNIQDGVATLSFPSLNNVGNAILTVIGYNRVTTRMEIEVLPAEGPYLILDSYEIVSQGEQVNYGEESTAVLNITNVGVEDIQDVTLTLSTENEYIQILNSTTVLEKVSAGETVSVPDIFLFQVSNDVPDQTKAEFFLQLTAGDYQWEGKFNVVLNAPELAMESFSTNDIHAGQTGTVNVVFINNGHAASPAGTVNVFSSSSDLLFTPSTVEIPSIHANETITVEFPVTVAEGVEEGSCYEVTYLLTADHYSIGGSIVMSVGNVMDGFESGDFSAFNWTFGGNQNWVIDSQNQYNGSYCAKSGSISDQQSSKLILEVNVPTAGEISFFKKVSSENNYDKLYFYIDGVEKENWSGTVNWSQSTYPIASGNHTLRWEYTKDYSVSGGQDCAWIDDVQLPATSVVYGLPPVAGLEAEVVENEVFLNWNPVERAASYTIVRNGEVVANQEEVSFHESVEHGVYTYCVIAVNEEGQHSQPSFVTIEVTSFLSVGEHSNSFLVYPNPTSGNLNIQVEGDYTYMLFNSFGQQVMNGHGHGEQQLDLSGFAKGIYLLHLNNGMNVNIQKVIVK